MKLDFSLLNVLEDQCEVFPGNIYQAKGGPKHPGTAYWLVIALNGNAVHCIGYNKEGAPVSTTSYGKQAFNGRPVVGFTDLSYVKLNFMPRMHPCRPVEDISDEQACHDIAKKIL